MTCDCFIVPTKVTHPKDLKFIEGIENESPSIPYTIQNTAWMYEEETFRFFFPLKSFTKKLECVYSSYIHYLDLFLKS